MKTAKFTMLILPWLLIGCASMDGTKHNVAIQQKKEVATTQSEPMLAKDKPAEAEEDKPVICHEVSDDNIKLIPLDTGVVRDTPIDVISHDLFVQRIKASPLWDKVSYSTPSQRNFLLDDLNAAIALSGIIGLKPEQIQKIYYRHLDARKRNKQGHQLLEQERFAMTELINLVIDDREKATEILDELYQNYLTKVRNNDTLSNGETLHAYVRYQGILFEMWGTRRTQHPLDQCNFDMMTNLIIN